MEDMPVHEQESPEQDQPFRKRSVLQEKNRPIPPNEPQQFDPLLIKRIGNV